MATNDAALKAFLAARGISPTGDIGATASNVIAQELTAAADQRAALFGREAADACEKLRFVAAKFQANPNLARSLPVVTSAVPPRPQ